MTELKFKNLSFQEEKEKIRVNFLKIFYCFLDKKDLEKISKYEVNKNSIIFYDKKKSATEKKFNFLLFNAFKQLKNAISNKNAVYIHKNSGIPLIGNVAFGLVDRNTSLIEIKPITSCNLNCIYCSVDQDKRKVDFVVEKDYLVDELKKLVKFKECNQIEAHIGTQGEPFLYQDIVELIHDISSIKEVVSVSIDTNGTLLDKRKIDELVKAGLTQINLSLDSLDAGLAKKIAGRQYDVNKIKEIAEYASKKLKLLIAPCWVPGINDQEIEEIIKFAKKLNAKIGIQNFLNYKHGKNVVKAQSWQKFFKRLKEFEKKYDVTLILSEKDFNIVKTKQLPKPFTREDIIKAEIKFSGQFKEEKIAVASGRTITVCGCEKESGFVKVKITGSKHNIFYAGIA